MKIFQDPLLRQMDDYIHTWESAADQRQIFLRTYRLMTGNMLQAVKKGFFHDAAWVNRLLHHFADYYFHGLECYECGNEVPAVWQHVHQLTKEDRLHPVQCLVLGVNAHINYDLVMSLYDVLQPEWYSLSPAQKEIRYDDHCRVNTVIAETIDRVQDEILEPGDPVLSILDRILGRLDEYLISKLITRWREEVWEHTQEMLACPDHHQREVIRNSIESKVLNLGELLS